VIDGVGAALWGPLLLAAGLMLRMRSVRAARLAASVLLGLVLMASVAMLGVLVVGDAELREAIWPATGSYADALAAAILPVVLACALATIVSAPRAVVTVETSSDALLLAGCAVGATLADGLPALLALSLVAMVPLGREARRGDDVLRRAFRFLVFTSFLPFAIAVAAVVFFSARAGVAWPFGAADVVSSGALDGHTHWIGPLLWVAAMARLGVFPFHVWVPAVAERVRAPAGSITIVSPLGALVALKAALAFAPQATAAVGNAILPLAAVSAAYGALLAVGQHHAGRQLGLLWVSTMGAVVAGLVALDARALSGALLQFLALLLAMTGLWSHVRAVACRTRTEDMRCLGGLVRSAPGLATGFLVLSLATVSFPGTATFLSADLLVQGLLAEHPVVSAVLLVSTALNGITLVRAYKRIFLGSPSAFAATTTIEDVLPRERAASLALVVALLIGGLAPTPLLLVKEAARGTLAASGGGGR